MNRKIIRMEHADATAKIFGNCDSNAHRIEKQFGVTLRNRETESGDSIVIEGEDMEMLNAAADCVAYLHDLCAKTEVITEQSLQYAIDMIAGPSEILVLADGKSDARVVAADMLSQAEHDRNATAVLVTESMDLAKAVQAELEIQLEALPRRDIARASVDNNGMIIVAESLTVGIEVANRLAPEHLELLVDDPFAYLDSIRNAGSVFLGRSCPEALGDYFAGPNHTLPTSGTARFSSPLGVDDFVKKSQFLYYTPDALNAVAEDVARFARKEGLEAHARSAVIRSGQLTVDS